MHTSKCGSFESWPHRCPYMSLSLGSFLGGSYPGCELVPDPGRVLSALTWNILGKVFLIWTGLFN